MMDDTSVGILGPGAVGHMLGYFLSQVGQLKVQLHGRVGALSESGSILLADGPVSFSLDTVSAAPRLWFVCLKAHALVEGLRSLLPQLAPGSQLIILSNGYIEPLLQSLRRDYPNVFLRKGLVTRGIKRDTTGAYIIGPKGQVIWGDERSPSPLESLILKTLSAQGFQWNPQACRLRREKWYFNTCLNTLCGVRRYARNGLALEDGREELEALSYEVLALARELWPDWQPAPRDLWQNLLRLIASTADNENSMAADVRLGRPTEAFVLSGMVRESHNPAAYPLLLALDDKLKRAEA